MIFPVHYITNNHASKNKAEEQWRMGPNSSLGPPHMYPHMCVPTYMQTFIHMYTAHAHENQEFIFNLQKNLNSV